MPRQKLQAELLLKILQTARAQEKLQVNVLSVSKTVSYCSDKIQKFKRLQIVFVLTKSTRVPNSVQKR